MNSKERSARLIVGGGALFVSTLFTISAVGFNNAPDQQRVIPHGDIVTGKDKTVRDFAAESALVGASSGVLSYAALIPAVLSRRRSRQSLLR